MIVSHFDVSAALPQTPTRRRLRHSCATVFLFALILVAGTAWPIRPTYAQSDQQGKGASQALTSWVLTWSDEFNGSGQADPTKWVNDVGGHGWGNHELEYYRTLQPTVRSFRCTNEAPLRSGAVADVLVARGQHR